MSKDLKRCTCLHCGFKSDDLVDHIESEHETLKEYVKRFKVKEHQIIFDESITEKEEAVGHAMKKAVEKSKEEKEEPKEVLEERSDSFKILGIDLLKGYGANNGAKVPKFNANYYIGKDGDPIAKRNASVLQDIAENRRVMLIGHTGTGKSTFIENIASRLNQASIRISCNGQITVGDMIGLWAVKGGDTVWIDGILTNAVRHGHWVILDEIDFAKEEILANLNALLEPDGELLLKEKGFETIVPHKNFRLFATANTIGRMKKFRHLYQGTNEMNEAFVDRWRVYMVDYLPKEKEIEVLMAMFPRLTKAIATTIVEVGGMIRAAFLKEEISTSFSTRKLFDFTDLLIRLKDPDVAAEIAIYSKIDDDAEIETIKGIIQRLMKGKKE